MANQSAFGSISLLPSLWKVSLFYPINTHVTPKVSGSLGGPSGHAASTQTRPVWDGPYAFETAGRGACQGVWPSGAAVLWLAVVGIVVSGVGDLVLQPGSLGIQLDELDIS